MTTRRQSPECFRNRCRIKPIEIWKVFLQGLRCLDGVVVWDPSIHMVRDVGAADVMVHEIKDRAIRPVSYTHLTLPTILLV